MNIVEIVTHCYAVEYPHFADALAYQLTSLMDQSFITATICRTSGDTATNQVVDRMRLKLDLRRIELPLGQLGRRSIGRNIAAKQSKSDIVWFADADYVFGEECLNKLHTMRWPEIASLLYPRQVMIHNDHATGDLALSRVKVNEFPEIDPLEFKPKSYSRAIGGAQIVCGEFARQYGYLDDQPRWHKPTTTPFRDTREDVAFQKFCKQHGQMLGIDLPGVYRLRHTTSAIEGH